MTSRWQGAPATACAWREWDGEAVVFVHATGDTHALSADGTAVLAAMRRDPELSATASEWMALADVARSHDEEYELELMRGLEAIGLVRRSAT